MKFHDYLAQIISLYYSCMFKTIRVLLLLLCISNGPKLCALLDKEAQWIVDKVCVTLFQFYHSSIIWPQGSHRLLLDMLMASRWSLVNYGCHVFCSVRKFFKDVWYLGIFVQMAGRLNHIILKTSSAFGNFRLELFNNWNQGARARFQSVGRKKFRLDFVRFRSVL